MRTRRTQRFGLILSDCEDVALKRLAEAEGGLSRAALLRKLVRHEAEARGLWPQARTREARHA
jgi:hypothetical protein